MGQDQRRFARVPESFSIQCRRRGAFSEGWRNVRTTDLSAGGIGFEGTELYEEQETQDIRITLPSFRVPLVLLGNVVRSRSQPGGMVDCAVEFIDVTPDQQCEIDELVAFLRKGV